MKTKPILFNTAMVQAILNGSKTQTRRAVKIQPIHDISKTEVYINENKWASRSGKNVDGGYHFWNTKCLYGKVGDVLWVREAFAEDDDTPKVIYKADHTKEVQDYVKWKPSIHMPKIACRIWLQITNIRVERLQDITEEDAIAEGVVQFSGLFKNYLSSEEPTSINCWYNSISSFRSLWQSINGEQSWQQNPWVWVIEFKQIDKPNN